MGVWGGGGVGGGGGGGGVGFRRVPRQKKTMRRGFAKKGVQTKEDTDAKRTKVAGGACVDGRMLQLRERCFSRRAGPR